MQTLLRNLIHVLSMLALIVTFQSQALSSPILTLATDSITETVTAGGTVTFKGTVTNRTNVDLSTMDLILNFSDYDPFVLEPTQLLGITDVSIPSFSFLTDLDLFSISVSPDARPGHYAFSVLLQDIFGNFDDPALLEVIVEEPSGEVPEPGTGYLVGLLLMVMMFTRRTSGGGAVLGAQ
jgi:hypothetical protein